MSAPLITLITVVRNGAKTIERTLESVRAQTVRNFEYLVLDGASTDGTQDIIARYPDIVTYTHSRPDAGAYDATCQGFALAKGRVVGLLHADDWLAPHFMDTLARMHEKKPAAQIFCFGMEEQRLEANGGITPTRRFCDPAGERFTLTDGFYCQGVNRFYARTLLQQEGYFKNDRYVQLADRELYIRLARRGIEKAWTEETLYYFLTHPGSNSTGGNARRKAEFLEETMSIAEDYLRLDSLTPEERILFADWLGFNALRAAYFRLRTGNIAAATLDIARRAAHSPASLFTNGIRLKMPQAYRAKALP